MLRSATAQKDLLPDVDDTSVHRQAFQQVLDEVRQRRDEFDAGSHVPRDMIERFKQIGIYRAATPKCFGGDALAPALFLQMIERISEADGSAGWVASFGSAGVYLAALPPQTLAEIYADSPDLVFAGGLFPLQPAEAVDGGWQVSGTWKFASGCKGADLLGVGIGAAGGKPRTAVFRADQVDIVENWDVVGLKGTGSHDLRVTDKHIDERWTFIRGGVATIDEPLFRYPSIAYAAQVLAVVNLGLARAALDEVSRMAAGSGITGAPKMADRAYVRIEIAKAEAQLAAARGFFYNATEQVWNSILAGHPVTPEQTSLLRLSAIHVSQAGAAVVQSAYSLAGTTAIYLRHPLQRYLRDSMVVTQHAFLSEGLYDGAGSVFLGVPPFPGYI
ncbi:alkylation response protein AidB-like acyl-CoA dehydrogenase [Pseudomonas sp. 3296]|uniref:acyl-CoA dehydrogenase family protein n=1 Tax=Pseudomonas sp. 3296 TaxID=2817753 RepID=UPI002865E5EB|nr:acyl-CoA dehydrogenase family protein [Pseudomonas sp. 3296]MDR6918230.1 alkylation response protein AidB-like acyl-CoA dehydrogenase [Pseudomonas sp. 3296]